MGIIQGSINQLLTLGGAAKLAYLRTPRGQASEFTKESERLQKEVNRALKAEDYGPAVKLGEDAIKSMEKAQEAFPTVETAERIQTGYAQLKDLKEKSYEASRRQAEIDYQMALQQDALRNGELFRNNGGQQ